MQSVQDFNYIQCSQVLSLQGGNYLAKRGCPLWQHYLSLYINTLTFCSMPSFLVASVWAPKTQVHIHYATDQASEMVQMKTRPYHKVFSFSLIHIFFPRESRKRQPTCSTDKTCKGTRLNLEQNLSLLILCSPFISSHFTASEIWVTHHLLSVSKFQGLG